MDIGKLVNYEHIHEYRVTFPNSERYCGITVGLRSESSETSKAVIRKHLNDQFQVKGRQRKQTAEAVEAQELEKIASTIAWWKWEKSDPSDEARAAMAKAAEQAKKDNKTEDEIAEIVSAIDDSEQASYNGDSNPELSIKLVVNMLTNVNWLYSQLKVAGGDVENFMDQKHRNA